MVSDISTKFLENRGYEQVTSLNQLSNGLVIAFSSNQLIDARQIKNLEYFPEHDSTLYDYDSRILFGVRDNRPFAPTLFMETLFNSLCENPDKRQELRTGVSPKPSIAIDIPYCLLAQNDLPDQSNGEGIFILTGPLEHYVLKETKYLSRNRLEREITGFSFLKRQLISNIKNQPVADPNYY